MIPTRYFLGRPDIGEEMHISIEKGKTLIIRLMAVGPVVEGQAQRDVWFEVNGEVYTSSSTRWRTLGILTKCRFELSPSKTRTLPWRPFLGRKPLMTQDLLAPLCLVSLLRSG